VPPENRLPPSPSPTVSTWHLEEAIPPDAYLRKVLCENIMPETELKYRLVKEIKEACWPLIRNPRLIDIFMCHTCCFKKF